MNKLKIYLKITLKSFSYWFNGCILDYGQSKVILSVLVCSHLINWSFVSVKIRNEKTLIEYVGSFLFEVAA